MLYQKKIKNLLSKKYKEDKSVFNVFKFKHQFLQSFYIFEEYLKDFVKIKEKINAVDLCAGTGIYSLFLGKLFNSYIEKIYATEKDKTSYKYLVENIKKNKLEKFVIPCKVKNSSNFDPYLCKEFLNNKKKIDVFISNPPYVPLPEGYNYFNWGNGGCLGINVVLEILKGIKKYSEEKSLLGILTYSLGNTLPEKGSIILGNINEEKLKIKQYKEYEKILVELMDQWSFKFHIISPPAWTAFENSYVNEYIDIEKYYRLIETKYNDSLQKHNKFLIKKNISNLSNIFIIGQKNINKKNTNVFIKNINEKYITFVMKTEKKCWPKYLIASHNNIFSRLKYFSKGCFGAFNSQGNLIGFATSQIINFKPYDIIAVQKFEPWMNLDSNTESNILQTQELNGNSLHLVSACVLPDYRYNGFWKDLIIARLKVAKVLDLRYIVMLSRLSLQNIHSDVQSIIRYIMEGNDPYLKIVKKFGFKINGIIEKQDDIESGGYWVLVYKSLK